MGDVDELEYWLSLPAAVPRFDPDLIHDFVYEELEG